MINHHEFLAILREILRSSVTSSATPFFICISNGAFYGMRLLPLFFVLFFINSWSVPKNLKKCMEVSLKIANQSNFFSEFEGKYISLLFCGPKIYLQCYTMNAKVLKPREKNLKNEHEFFQIFQNRSTSSLTFTKILRKMKYLKIPTQDKWKSKKNSCKQISISIIQSTI